MIDFKTFQSSKISFIFWIISKLNIKFLVTLICLLFLGASIYANFDDLSKQTINLREILWLSCGILFSFLSIIINAYAWKMLIISIGCNSKKLNIVKIFLNTNMYKYLPGGIWHFVSRFNILRLNFSIQKSVESILLEPLLMLVAGLIFIPFGNSNIYIWIICWSSPLVFLPRLRDFIIKNLKLMKSNIFTNSEKVIDKNFVKNKPNNSTEIFYPYKSLLIEIIFILFRYLGFFCCISAFNMGSLLSQWQLISSFSLAWIIGLIVPAAPGGLGVFESVFLFSLASQLPEAPLLAALLCYRLASTVADIFAALVFPVKRLLKV